MAVMFNQPRFTSNPSSHTFAKAPSLAIPRNAYDRSYVKKTTFNAGKLIPFHVDEVYPGDVVNLGVDGLIRTSTFLFPIMDYLYISYRFFFVPNRILQTNWVKMCGEQEDPTDPVNFTAPKISGLTAQTGDIADMMGIPTLTPNELNRVNAYPFRAYNLIINTYYRDQNADPSLSVLLNDGPDPYNTYTLFNVRKSHDYFTSALPFLQKGPAVQIPLGVYAPIVTTNVTPFMRYPTDVGVDHSLKYSLSGALTLETPLPPSNEDVVFGSVTGLQADLGAATAATLPEWRQAITLQQYYELDARSGTRYGEKLRAHWHTAPRDERLQYPEYLGGGVRAINVHAVAQTSGASITGETTVPASLSAFGTSIVDGLGCTYTVEEFGFIIGLCAVHSAYSYQQGIERFWTRTTIFDWYWPIFAQLSEQPIRNEEIYAIGTSGPSTQDTETFAYQEPWGDLRYKPNQVCGLFRSNAMGTLDGWHLGQDFSALPVWGPTFLEENPPMSRVLAVADEPNFIAEFVIKNHVARNLPLYGVPGLRRF
ncbi:MAG: major capsid protein [Microvirus sp.]|nr:MAG: major capsid protein [Microvirus sp.]